jgi:hypothetical protein
VVTISNEYDYDDDDDDDWYVAIARLWACRVCAPAPDLIADIRQRVKRPLSPQERRASGLAGVGGSPGQ